jgi:hypothetical protein
MSTDVSEEHIASIVRIGNVSSGTNQRKAGAELTFSILTVEAIFLRNVR